MAKRTETRRGGSGKWLFILFLIAAIIAAAYFLNRCGMGGFGLGKGEGPGTGTSGTASATPSSSAPRAPSSASAAAGNEPVLLRVAGTSCKYGKAEEALECEKACERAEADLKGREKREVRFHPSKGSQEVVEKLKKCLSDRGLVTLEVDD